jgi:hypothetical protein
MLTLCQNVCSCVSYRLVAGLYTCTLPRTTSHGIASRTLAVLNLQFGTSTICSTAKRYSTRWYQFC